ncbi:hypothetical protein M9H77_22177 [Catharanthus roseus]|uniref:Uncharacterized protein n=1 Tax=Catharanthus roseus TaxID=4058 RepID=A0ACC0AQM6_CATRO|nr:hypothetical protein M9H77_22177 [Catharanthus roseus]
MAPSSSSRKKGKRKVSIELVNVVGEDRISNLPDCILYFILSFLPILHYSLIFFSMLGVRMRFLTQPQTTWVSILKNLLTGFLFMIMLLHLKICISIWREKISKLHFDSWISVVIATNIKHLDLQTSYIECIELPKNLFICEILECLKLCDLQTHTLILFSVTFGDEKTFHKLVDGCLILEILCFIKNFHEWDFMPTLLVSSPTLKKFDMTLSSYYDSMVFEIRAPLLQYLSISNFFKRKLILNSLSSLFEVYIDVTDVYVAKEAGEISYSNSTLSNLGNATAPLPKFPRLSKFAINGTISFTCLKDCEDDLQLIKYFLQHGEILEKIDQYVANNLNTKVHLEMGRTVLVLIMLIPRNGKLKLIKSKCGKKVSSEEEDILGDDRINGGIWGWILMVCVLARRPWVTVAAGIYLELTARYSSDKEVVKFSSESDDLGDDGIRNLSDSILYFILSFIPTIETIQINALSTRWKCLWTKVSILHRSSTYKFSYYSVNKTQEHARFLEKIDIYVEEDLDVNLKFERLKKISVLPDFSNV